MTRAAQILKPLEGKFCDIGLYKWKWPKYVLERMLSSSPHREGNKTILKHRPPADRKCSLTQRIHAAVIYRNCFGLQLHAWKQTGEEGARRSPREGRQLLSLRLAVSDSDHKTIHSPAEMLKYSLLSPAIHQLIMISSKWRRGDILTAAVNLEQRAVKQDELSWSPRRKWVITAAAPRLRASREVARCSGGRALCWGWLYTGRIHPSIHPSMFHAHPYLLIPTEVQPDKLCFKCTTQNQTISRQSDFLFSSAHNRFTKKNLKLLLGVDVIPLDVFTFCLMNHPQKQAVWSHDPEAVTGFNPDYIFSRSSANV